MATRTAAKAAPRKMQATAKRAAAGVSKATPSRKRAAAPRPGTAKKPDIFLNTCAFCEIAAHTPGMSNDTASSAGMNRAPKGISTGGQFAATAHAEPTLSLATERLSELVDVEELVDIAYTSAAYWQRRYNQADKSVIIDRTTSPRRRSFAPSKRWTRAAKSLTSSRWSPQPLPT